jgi:hypothetical protein
MWLPVEKRADVAAMTNSEEATAGQPLCVQGGGNRVLDYV